MEFRERINLPPTPGKPLDLSMGMNPPYQCIGMRRKLLLKIPPFKGLFLVLLFFIFSMCPPAFAGEPQELLEKALDAYEKENFETASSYFEKYAPFSKLLKDYVCFWWAGSLKETGKDKEAIHIYNKISPDNPIGKKAVEELIGLYRKKCDWISSLNLIKERAALETNKKSEPFWQKEALATGYLTGTPHLATDNFKKLIKDFPGTKEALEVLEKYGSFYSFKDDKVFRAKVYLIHKNFEKALECLENGSFAIPGMEDSEILRLKAEAFCGLKDYKKAVSILEKLVKEGSGDEVKFRLAEIYLLGPREEKGISILEELAGEKQSGKIACLSLWKLFNYWGKNNNEQKSKMYYEKLRQGYGHFSLTDKAIWMEGWSNMSGKNYTGADRAWQAFDDISRNSRQKLSALYLRRWINSLSNNKEAESISKRLASLYPDTYYGLQILKDSRVRKIGVGAKLGELENEADFDSARALLKLTRFEEAVLELESLKKKRYNDINLRYNLSLAYGRADKFCEAVAEAELLVDFFAETGKWPGFIHVAEKELLEINFPRFYREEVERMAGEFKLDENLIYAVIREESKFNEKDVSGSGAIGLMQLLPSTADWIMENAGPCTNELVPGTNLNDVSRKDIFNPGLNIFLGSWYLRYLLDKFDGDILLAVASYNGGPGLIERWVKSGGLTERDIAIEMMPKEETKYYCQKVLFSYYMYKMIWKEGK
jgi:hypothetical protein